MAFVTPIGANPEQIEYRLLGSHGCNPARAADAQFSYHADGSERPLVWTGAGLPQVGITPGTVLDEAQFDTARALMAGLDPRTGEQLVSPKLAVHDDAKLPMAPLVAAVRALAAEQGVDPGELIGSVKVRTAYGRAARAVANEGEAAALRADEAGDIADAAGADVADVWGEAVFAGAVANLTTTALVTDAAGVSAEKVVPRRRVVGNLGYDVSFTLPKSHSLLLAFADEETAAAVEGVYTVGVADTFDWLESQTAYGMRGHHGDGRTATRVDGSGFLGWSMVHRAARPVGDRVVGDPHWHVHVTIANMTKGEDEKWSTVAAGGRDLMRHAPAADHVLKALVRRQLVDRFGVEFARSERTGAWEVAAIPDATLQVFSKRGASIEAMLRDLGFDPAIATRRAEDLAAAQTRQDKTHSTAAPDMTLRQVWQDEARQAGMDPDLMAAQALPRRPDGFPAGTPRDPRTGQDVVADAPLSESSAAEEESGVDHALREDALDEAQGPTATLEDLVLDHHAPEDGAPEGTHEPTQQAARDSVGDGREQSGEPAQNLIHNPGWHDGQDPWWDSLMDVQDAGQDPQDEESVVPDDGQDEAEAARSATYESTSATFTTVPADAARTRDADGARDVQSLPGGEASGDPDAPDGAPGTMLAAPAAGLGADADAAQSPAEVALAAVMVQLLDPESGLTSSARRFTRVDAIAAVADALPDGASDVAEIEALTDRALTEAGVVALPQAPAAGAGEGVQASNGARRQLGAPHMTNADRYTTLDVIDAEHVILTAAAASAEGQGAASVSAQTVALAQQVVEAGQGFTLSEEQGDILAALVTSDRAVDTVLGPPGTGKTTLMRAARTAWEAGGYVVAGAATAAVAAANLGAESGITSHTVAQWVRAIETGRGLTGVDVLVLDEANLTDDRDRARLYQEAQRTGTKVVEVGDPKQLRGVGCGSLFGRVHQLVEGTALTANRRQRDEDERAAIAAWREGAYTTALTSWSERGRLVATETGDQALTAMVAAWMHQRAGAPDPHAEMRGVVMLAASNEAVERLNEAAQSLRGAAGELGSSRTYAVRAGRRIILHEGDHVLIRLNDRAQRMHTGPDVLNGYRGVVEAIASDGSVQVAWDQDTSDGPVHQQGRLDPAYVAAGGLSLGYAMTGHKAEGLTVSADWTAPDGRHQGGTVLVYAPGMDTPGMHVATSRHRDQVLLFAGREQLESAAETYEHGASTTDQQRAHRVITALGKEAKAREKNPSDRPVHDDLGLAYQDSDGAAASRPSAPTSTPITMPVASPGPRPPSAHARRPVPTEGRPQGDTAARWAELTGQQPPEAPRHQESASAATGGRQEAAATVDGPETAVRGSGAGRTTAPTALAPAARTGEQRPGGQAGVRVSAQTLTAAEEGEIARRAVRWAALISRTTATAGKDTPGASAPTDAQGPDATTSTRQATGQPAGTQESRSPQQVHQAARREEERRREREAARRRPNRGPRM